MNAKSKWGLTLVTASLIALVGVFEGTRHKVYLDVGGVPTVCEGYTGPEVVLGDVWTPARCAEAFKKALAAHGAGVLSCTTREINQETYEALTSLAYNIGVGAYCKSTASRKINEGDFKAACEAIKLFNKADGKVWKGLVSRRAVESSLCLKANNV